MADRRRQRLRRRADGSGGFFIGGLFCVDRHEARRQHRAHQGRRHARHGLERQHERHRLRARRLGRRPSTPAATSRTAGGAARTRSRRLLPVDRRARDRVQRQRDGHRARSSTRSSRRARRSTSAASSRRSAAAAGPTSARSTRPPAVTGWAPTRDGAVYALAAGSGVVYAGGAFTTSTRTPRVTCVAAFSTSTGAATSWDPSAGRLRLRARGCRARPSTRRRVRTIGGATRNGLAALDTQTRARHELEPERRRPGLSRSRSRGRPSTRAAVRARERRDGAGQRRRLRHRDRQPRRASRRWSAATVDALAVSGTTRRLGGEFRTAGAGGATNGPVRARTSPRSTSRPARRRLEPAHERQRRGARGRGLDDLRGRRLHRADGTGARDRLAAFT